MTNEAFNAVDNLPTLKAVKSLRQQDFPITVVTPTFNGEPFLAETIQSVLAQRVPCRLIVVDDGSTDGTLELLARYGQRIEVLQQQNRGTAAARNLGLDRANTPYIAFLDHDDVWEPDTAAVHLALLSDRPDAVATYGRIEFFDSVSRNSLGSYYPGDRLDTHHLLRHNGLALQATLLRTRAAKAVGGFNPAFSGSDDWDAALRLAQQGVLVGVDEILARVRHHDSQQSKRARQMYRTARKVLQANSRYHVMCEECRAAVAACASLLRHEYYEQLRDMSYSAWRGGRRTRAAGLAARACMVEPAAVKRRWVKSLETR